MQGIQGYPVVQISADHLTESVRLPPSNQDGVLGVAGPDASQVFVGLGDPSVSVFVARPNGLRGKHGPESRISPMGESPITQAIRTSITRTEEHVFLPVVGMKFNSAKEAKYFYNLYYWEIGFGIRKGRNKVNQNNYTTRHVTVAFKLSLGRDEEACLLYEELVRRHGSFEASRLVMTSTCTNLDKALVLDS